MLKGLFFFFKAVADVCDLRSRKRICQRTRALLVRGEKRPLSAVHDKQPEITRSRLIIFSRGLLFTFQRLH